jgi:hypothetical protein
MIDQGRKWLDTDGLEHEGRISYRTGLSLALAAFKDAQTIAAENLAFPLGAEYTFLYQEFHFCAVSDTKTKNSLIQAIQDFDDAFLVLELLQNSGHYKLVECAFSHRSKCRYYGMPKDAFHIACSGHKMRINNIVRSPGINIAEKELLHQRLANITTIQSVYLLKQKKHLELVNQKEFYNEKTHIHPFRPLRRSRRAAVCAGTLCPRYRQRSVYHRFAPCKSGE